MKTEINTLALPINNLQRIKKFYADVFGWRLVSENDHVVMFRMSTNILTLCNRSIFSSYSKLFNYRMSNKGMPLTVHLSSAKEVDERFNNLEAAGAKIINLPTNTPDGYCGSLMDPENNQWVICYQEVA